jgi:hypothetical protein
MPIILGCLYNNNNSGCVVNRFFSSPQRPDRLWRPLSPLSGLYRRFFGGDKLAGAWSWPLTSVSAEWRMCRAIPPVPHTSAWHRAVLSTGTPLAYRKLLVHWSRGLNGILSQSAAMPNPVLQYLELDASGHTPTCIVKARKTGRIPKLCRVFRPSVRCVGLSWWDKGSEDKRVEWNRTKEGWRDSIGQKGMKNREVLILLLLRTLGCCAPQIGRVRIFLGRPRLPFPVGLRDNTYREKRMWPTRVILLHQ